MTAESAQLVEYIKRCVGFDMEVFPLHRAAQIGEVDRNTFEFYLDYRFTAVTVDKILNRIAIENLTVIYDSNPVAQPLGFFHVVRGVNDGSAFTGQVLD